MKRLHLAVDIGGTFTDIVLLGSDGTIFTKKIPSTPEDYSEAIERGVHALLDDLGMPASEIGEFVHGTTVATNAIIERRGAKVALVTTRGFRDVLEIGRFRTPRLYDFSCRKPEPLVERRLRFEVKERISGQGEVVQELDPADLERVASRLRQEGIEAVAVCFLNAYVNPLHEQRAAAFLRESLPGISVSASTQFLPQIQEYERTSTIVLNAYLRPVVGRYLTVLQQRLRRLGIQARPLIMQSSGGVLPADRAAENPVYVIESGPAAGVVGAQRLAQQSGLPDVMVLDIGGTTAKAALIEDHAFSVTTETEVGGGPILGHRLIRGSGYIAQVPTIDIAEVGAGGGSIASADRAGGIQVGPHSAGAVPGPVCYDRGGTSPTVTDANLILGYLNPTALLGGDLRIDRAKAERALARLGQRVGLSAIETAYGIHQIANATMMRALKGVSSERGQDPSRFTLLAMGGGGGVHAASLAEAMRMRRIVIPPVAGLFSALGLVFADIEHQLITGFYRRLDRVSAEDLNGAFAPLVDEATQLLQAGGFVDANDRLIDGYADVKYVGQTSSLVVRVPRVPITTEVLAQIGELFAQQHERTFGYRSEDEAVQFVALKVIGRGVSSRSRVPQRISESRPTKIERSERQAYFGPEQGWLPTPVLDRRSLSGAPRSGQFIVEEYDSTTVVRPGWRARLDEANNIVLERTST